MGCGPEVAYGLAWISLVAFRIILATMNGYFVTIVVIIVVSLMEKRISLDGYAFALVCED